MKLCFKSILVNHINRDLTPIEYISITLDAICRRRCSSGRTVRPLKSKLNKLKSLKFRFGKRRSTVSKRVGQHFKPLKHPFKKRHLFNASQHLKCVNYSNLKHYHR